jgi:hypothetical protein
MGRRFLARFVSLILGSLCWINPILAQGTSGTTGDSPSESSGPVFPYGIIVLFTIVILVIICKPSRKS